MMNADDQDLLCRLQHLHRHCNKFELHTRKGCHAEAISLRRCISVYWLGSINKTTRRRRALKWLATITSKIDQLEQTWYEAIKVQLVQYINESVVTSSSLNAAAIKMPEDLCTSQARHLCRIRRSVGAPSNKFAIGARDVEISDT